MTAADPTQDARREAIRSVSRLLASGRCACTYCGRGLRTWDDVANFGFAWCRLLPQPMLLVCCYRCIDGLIGRNVVADALS